MAQPLSADALIKALRAEGCQVTEYRDWRTHNRDHMGDWGPVYGVMIHHTVTSGTEDSVRLCYEGHSSLPGPLCHSVGAKDGRIYMVGHGRANHAGLGDSDVLEAVIAERDLPPDREANTDGNRYFYGIELVNLGDGKDPWPEVQVDAAARWAAAICRAHGWSHESVIGHNEWQPGKVDPLGIAMDGLRGRVKDLLAAEPGGQDSGEDEEMPKYLAIGMGAEFTLTPGTWRPIEWGNVWSDPLDQVSAGQRSFLENAQYVGTAHVRLSGLTRGSEVQLRLVEMDKATGKTVKFYPIGEGVGTAGDTFMTMPVCGKVPAGRQLRLRVIHHGTDVATVKQCEIKAQVWPL